MVAELQALWNPTHDRRLLAWWGVMLLALVSQGQLVALVVVCGHVLPRTWVRPIRG